LEIFVFYAKAYLTVQYQPRRAGEESHATHLLIADRLSTRHWIADCGQRWQQALYVHVCVYRYICIYIYNYMYIFRHTFGMQFNFYVTS